MPRLHHKIAGGLLAAGLLTGMVAGAVAPAGATSLGLIPTTLVASSSFNPSNGETSLSATVSLELVKGALITPSGSVVFTGYNNLGGYNFGSGTLSRCLLGLPSLLGLWTETCTANATPTAAEQRALDCSVMNIGAEYNAATDLLAKSSSGSTVTSDNC